MEDITLLKFIRNEATPQELDAVLDWLDASPENRKYLNSLDDTDFALDLWTRRLKDTQRAPANARRLDWRRIVRWTTSAAAVILLGLSSGFFLYKHQMAQIAGQRLETTAPKGQRMQVKLGDGTSVWLNAGSSIAYPPIFAGKERRVRLSGEAIFEVVHDEKCPFVVETFACDARVLGTRFDIVADEDAGTFSAALLEGKLQLVNRMSDETVMMTLNEIVRLRHGKLYRQQLSDHDDYLWPEGIISLKGLSFGELMTKLERAFNVRIVIKRDQLPDANFGWGKIAVSSGVEHALEVLQCAADFRYEIDKDSGVITIL